ncbi:MAG: hypothetical protein NW214_17210 [Pseudanabaenaceae cyanobacterium bins.39]|nr:hypothetical protein [Pseudanabaenaceae cyanobacterium bins.39]
MQITEAPIKATGSPTVSDATLTLPDHKQLPDSDGTFVKNFKVSLFNLFLPFIRELSQ